MNRFRVALACLVASVAVGAWAVSALAGQQTRSIATVTVAAGKPTELHFVVAPLKVKSGIVIFKVTNKGMLPHDFAISGRKTKMLNGGKSDTLRLTLRKGNWAFKCTVPGHAAAGMRGVLRVT